MSENILEDHARNEYMTRYVGPSTLGEDRRMYQLNDQRGRWITLPAATAERYARAILADMEETGYASASGSKEPNTGSSE